MEFELDPPHGVTGFPLGMGAQDLKEAAAALGRVKVTDEGRSSRFTYMKVVALHPQFEVVFHCEDGRSLGAVEIWAPREGPEDVTVRFRGTDVFRTPARVLKTHLSEAGLDVVDESGSVYVPGTTLGLTRTAGHDVPLDTDGLPLYFQAVLTAPEDYYAGLFD